jgi:hypothetical protein
MANPGDVQHRRQLSEPQHAMVAARLLPHFKDEAKARSAENAKRNQPQNQKRENLPVSEKGRARDKAGEAVRVSGRSAASPDRVAVLGAAAGDAELCRTENRRVY